MIPLEIGSRVRLERGPLGGCVVAPVVAVAPDRFSVRLDGRHVLTFDRATMRRRPDSCPHCLDRFRFAALEMPA